MALTKAEMSEHLFEKLGLSKRDAKDLVEIFFEEVRRALENGEQVKLSGFGNFDLRDKTRDRDVTRKPGKISRLRRAVLLLSVRGRSSRAGSRTRHRKSNTQNKKAACGWPFSYLTSINPNIARQCIDESE